MRFYRPLQRRQQKQRGENMRKQNVRSERITRETETESFIQSHSEDSCIKRRYFLRRKAITSEPV